MVLRDSSDVARRCLCLELLLQRLGLEIETDDAASARDEVRRKWLDKLPELGLEEVRLPWERAALERPVGDLWEDELDDIPGRAAGALVLLWSLTRLPVRPSFATVDDMESMLADHGLLG